MRFTEALSWEYQANALILFNNSLACGFDWRNLWLRNMINRRLADIFKRILELWNLTGNAKRFAKMRRRKIRAPAFTTLALTLFDG